jgi:hypothetical protein
MDKKMFPMTITNIKQAFKEIKQFVGNGGKAGDAVAGEGADSTADHRSPGISLDIRTSLH